MKTYTRYSVEFLTGLLTLNALSGCIHTRQKLGMDSTLQKDATTEESLVSSATNRPAHDGLPLVRDPIVLTREIVQYLSSHEHDFSKKSIKNCFDQGLDRNAQDKKGNSLLVFAIGRIGEGRENKDPITFLLDNGADVNLQDNNGVTSLMHAVVAAGSAMGAIGDVEDIMDLLIKHGADMSIKNVYGQTALDHIAYINDENIKVRIEGKLKAAMEQQQHKA